MTDLAIRDDTVAQYQEDPTGGRLVAWAQAASAAHQLASALCSTTFVPQHFRNKPDDTAAAIMTGDELGLSPLAALRSIYVISGTPALYTRGMVALALSRGHEIWTKDSTPTSVTVQGRRRGSSQVETSTWTIERARTAGYTNNKKYSTNPQEMLYSKAAAEVARKIAADVLAGVPYSVEDLELDDDATPATEPVKVARRKKPEPETAPTGEAITEEQRKHLHALVNELGLTREQKLQGAAAHAGRPIESTSDLTKAEASRVIDALITKAAEKKAADGLGAEVIDGEIEPEGLSFPEGGEGA